MSDEVEKIIGQLVEKNDKLRDSYSKLENEVFSHGPEGRNYTNQQYVDLLQKFESLKAITELAVKNLQYYADPSNYGAENLSLYGFIPIDDDGGLMARMTLEVIELRLKNG